MEGGRGAKSKTIKSPSLSLEQFVSTMAPLIDLEKEAEISASISTGASRNLDAAQKRGSTILNLKCVDAQGTIFSFTTIQSVEAEKKGLGKTLFERLADMYGNDVMSMLTVQYRMHELIMNWSSKELYNSKIKAHSSVAGHVLYDLEDVKKTSSTEATLLLIDRAGCDMEEKKDEEENTLNEGEAEVAMAHARRLVQSAVQASDIGIITPYNAQVVLLKIMKSNEDKLKDMEISTVDGFQGWEKEAIIISMVRSNSKKGVGFLSDRRRMNVAVTRARRQCCLVCDTETVSSDGFLKRLIEYFEQHGEYASASECTTNE